MGRNQRIALAVAAAVVLLAGVVAVFMVTGGDDDDRVETTATEDTAADAEGDDDGATEPDTGNAEDPNSGSGEPGSATPTSAAAPGAGDQPVTSSRGDAKAPRGESADTMATTPPKAGAYKYRVVRDGETGEMTTRVEDRGREGDTVRQRIVLESEEGSLDNEVAWRPDGLYILESTFFGGKCDWNPDSLQLRLPLAAGVTWTSESSCTAETDFGTFDIKRKLTGEVTGKQRVTVAGEAVDVWVIEEQEQRTFSGERQGPGGAPQPIAGTDDSTATVLFSPKHGLSVKYDRASKTTMGANSSERTVSAEILNLTPQ